LPSLQKFDSIPFKQLPYFGEICVLPDPFPHMAVAEQTLISVELPAIGVLLVQSECHGESEAAWIELVTICDLELQSSTVFPSVDARSGSEFSRHEANAWYA
jgi:hypothetical protein